MEFHVLHGTRGLHKGEMFLSPTGLSPTLARTFQSASAKNILCNSPAARYRRHTQPRNPIRTNAQRLTAQTVWAIARSLTTT